MNFGSRSAPPPPNTTEYQKPTSEILRIGGQHTTSRLYNPSTRTYTTTINPKLGDIQIEDNSRIGLARLSQDARGFRPTQGNLENFQEMLAAPQRDAVNSVFDKAQGDAMLQASGNGMANSGGFARYLAGELAGERADSLADVERDAFLNRGSAMMADFAPLAGQANFFQALRGGQQAQMGNLQNQILQGAQQGLGAQANALNAANSQYQNQLARFQAYQPGFLGRLFGG